ncbi:MAG: helix-turn-helix transcriptional regulator [Rhizobiaceae bacterium]
MPAVHGGGQADSLEDRIYEAAVLPEFWPGILQQMSRITEGVGSVLLSVRGADVRYMASTADFQRDVEAYFAAFPGINERMRRLLAVQRAGFVSDADVFAPEERETIPIFRDFLTPRGYGNGIATVVLLPSGELILFHNEGRHSRATNPAEVVTLDALRPHLARSALISARLSFERARTAVETLAGLGLAACAVSRSGAVLVANEEFDAAAHWTTRGGNRIALPDKRANQQLDEALGAIATDQGVRSLPLVGGDETPPAVLHVVPIRRAAHDLFGHAAAILVLTRASTEPTGATPLLQVLFDLSAVEADVAARIAAGQTVEQIAVSSGKSVNTVRNQLKSVLDKTACARQADLARLLAQLIPPGSATPTRSASLA